MELSTKEQETLAIQTEARLRWLLLSGLSGDRADYRDFLHLSAMLLRAFYGRRLLHRSDEVENVVQEALMAIHRQRHTYAAHATASTWLFAIAQQTLDAWLQCPRASAEANTANVQGPSHAAPPGLAKASNRDLEKICNLLMCMEQRLLGFGMPMPLGRAGIA